MLHALNQAQKYKISVVQYASSLITENTNPFRSIRGWIGSKELISKADKPVKINATTMGSAMYGDPTIRISALSCPAVAEVPMLSESYSASQQAYEKSGIGSKDVDILELPDNSSWHYLVYLESCGFCKEGEADKMMRDGETKIGGRLPFFFI